MAGDSILERLSFLLADYTDRIVLPDSNLVTDLGLDSLSTMDLALRLENEFNILDFEYDPEHMQTVNDLAEVIADRVHNVIN